MCLLLLALESHPVYKLVIAANRDEFYDRPTAPASFWDDRPDILGGRDLRAGGTWFGINKKGRVAAITNYRDPASIKSNAPSRGELVSDFLTGDEKPEEYFASLDLKARAYNGFNLLVGVKDQICWYSNRGKGTRSLIPGIYGVSNHLLDTPWPKVSRGKSSLENILLNNPITSPEVLFHMLLDRSIPDDDNLPDTGVGLEWERLLSPIFIASPNYGTRSSTILLIDQNDHVTFMERTHIPSQDQSKEVVFEFPIED
ncbi:MAG: NRDE family protein [Deltaproteobacteria bacterium]|uniref:NRDE family protein n=1 Tax=Candidatus Desulfacyla euxinica TaxID=2841693 RepID=A0A8J6N3P4_9DELT|nr:NRDE family protein [Candidatus Desulfacyla euxinica]MBL7216896.1 NRDE family protein [Desulfobacteraceae bacterium]